MHATTVRFGEDLWTLLEREASSQGVSTAQFVRDAAIMRLGALSARRGDPEAALTLEELAAGALSGRGGAADRVVRDRRRLAALHATGLLDSPPEESFDRLATLAAKLLNTPVALISLIDEERQFFKSCHGLGEPWSSARETPLSHSYCRHALNAGNPLVIEDARSHPLVRGNPAITELKARAYAGAPLITGEGHALGTLCVLDEQPRSWTADQIETLSTLAAAVMSEIELSRRNIAL
jgi:hypothetical protein